MDRVAAVWCVSRMRSFRSPSLLKPAGQLFTVAAHLHLTVSSVLLPGRDNVWADALFRTEASSAEWSLLSQAVQGRAERGGHSVVGLLDSPTFQLIPLCLSKVGTITAGGPDAFMTVWDAGSSIYLFSDSGVWEADRLNHRGSWSRTRGRLTL